jgi:hypothetical protein
MTTDTDPGSTTPTDGDKGGDAPPESTPPAEPVAGDTAPAPAPAAPAPKDITNPDSNAQIAAALNRQNEILDAQSKALDRLNDALVPEDDDDADQTAHPDDATASVVVPDPPPQPHADEVGVPNGDEKVPGKKGWRRFV